MILIGHIPCFPYIYYGIAAWAQAEQGYLRNILILQKRALRLMFFAGSGSHAIVLFLAANILPRNMLYFETVCGRVGAVVRALAFLQCGPGSISALGVKCGLSLLVLYSAMRGFPPGTPVFPSQQKPTFDLICRKHL